LYRIAVDVMGGDNPPSEIIKGAVNACYEDKLINLILVGKYDIIMRELDALNANKTRIHIEDATEIITMDEAPARALRKKKRSCINIGTNLVKDGKADAFISPGNTGAVMAGGLFNIGRAKGIKRPPIAINFPAINGETLVLDNGANTDSSPENLLQFALMGQVFAKEVQGIKNPRIGLLSIGSEKKKGNKLTKATYELLVEDKRIENFIGNVEGRDIFSDTCDIILTDGFVGNVVLKTTEGAASFFLELLKSAFKTNWRAKLGALLLKPYLKKVLNKIDYRQYGGAPLLGLNGVVIISHGSSDDVAIYNAIKVARKTIENNVVKLIEAEINDEEEDH